MADDWDDENDQNDNDGPSRNGYMFIGLAFILAALLVLAIMLWGN